MNITPDLAHEQYIDRCYFEMLAANSPEKRREAFDRMRAAINLRSQEQVAQMERERGLR